MKEQELNEFEDYVKPYFEGEIKKINKTKKIKPKSFEKIE